MTDQNAPAKCRREVRRGGRAARKAARAAAVVEAQASAPAYICLLYTSPSPRD